MTLTRRNFTKLAGAALASTLAAPALAQGKTKIKMILNWRYQGPQSWFFLAQDKGYFDEAGIEMTMDQGNGSGAAVGHVAGGAYDVGFGDVNALIRLAGTKPEEAPLCVYQMYNKPPFTVAVLADSDIHTAEDLQGRLLGGAANDGALKLFPAFANVAGLDTSGIEILNFKSNLREQMLKNKEVEGVFGYVNTIRFSAKLSGMNPDEEIRFISYGDYGMDLYSNGLIVPKAMAADSPEMVKGNWLKPGATVIDVGINRLPGEGGKSRLVGDVDFGAAAEVAGAITPVPGGVGPMTIACLLANTVTAACRAHGLSDPEGLTA